MTSWSTAPLWCQGLTGFPSLYSVVHNANFILSLCLLAVRNCCSVAQSCPTLCNPMDCSTPGFPVHHRHPKFISCPSNRWYHPTISSFVIPFSSCFQSFPASGSFPMSQLFTSGGQSIGASASASVLPMNIQNWFPLELTGLISLLSKRLKTPPASQFEIISPLVLSPIYGPTLFMIHYWSGLSFPPPGDLPNSEIKPMSLLSPSLAGCSLPLVLHGNLNGNWE